jgi:hypothetical protein
MIEWEIEKLKRAKAGHSARKAKKARGEEGDWIWGGVIESGISFEWARPSSHWTWS